MPKILETTLPADSAAAPIWEGLPDPPRFAVIDGRAMASSLMLGLQFGANPQAILDAIESVRQSAPRSIYDASFKCLGQCSFDPLDPSKGSFPIYGVTEDGLTYIGHLLNNPATAKLMRAYVEGFSKLARFLLEERHWAAQEVDYNPGVFGTGSTMSEQGFALLEQRIPARHAFYRTVGLVGIQHFAPVFSHDPSDNAGTVH